MRKPRPATYNPAQALQLIASDRTGAPLQLPILLRRDHARPNEEAAAAALARHAAVRAVRPRRPLHRRRRLTHGGRDLPASKGRANTHSACTRLD